MTDLYAFPKPGDPSRSIVIMDVHPSVGVNPPRPASYPRNGREPTDDVADAFLAVITNGKVTGDGVGPHSDLLTEFPYLAPPHTNRSPMEAGLETVGQAGHAR